MSSDDAIRKGQAAKALLENADFNIAIDTVRLEAFKGWAGSDSSEREKREEYYYLLQATDRLKDNLKALVTNARFEEHKIARDEAEAKAKANPEQSGDKDD